MRIELLKMGLSCTTRQPIDVYYEHQKVGLYKADLIVNNCVIVELKAAEGIVPEHEAQLTNYLKATDIEVGLLLNFGREPQQKRKVFANERKIIIDHTNHKNQRSIHGRLKRKFPRYQIAESVLVGERPPDGQTI